MNKVLPLLVASLLLCSCNAVIKPNLTLTQFETGEVITGNFNIVSHWVEVTMPDGEVLQGHASVMFENEETAAWHAYALLKSSKSNLMLELSVKGSGYSGFGDAQTNNGKKYRVQL